MDKKERKSVLDTVFNDQDTRDLAKAQMEAETKALFDNVEVILSEEKTVVETSEVESKTVGQVDVSVISATMPPEEFQKLLAEWQKGLPEMLKTEVEKLVDKKMEDDLRMKESYPHQTSDWKETYEKREKRRHDETKKWMNSFKKSPVHSKLAEALIFSETFKTPLGRKLAVKLFELDRKVYNVLNEVANMEFIVTKYNIVSKAARRLLGVRLPDEPEYVESDKGVTTRWDDISSKAAKNSFFRDSDPDRVMKNTNKLV